MMLRYIVSVGLAMTACATFISTKANAATLTITPVGTLQKKPGDLIEFIVGFDVPNSNLLYFLGFGYQYDKSELSLALDGEDRTPLFAPVGSSIGSIARLTFNVLQPVEDGMSDLFNLSAFLAEDVDGIRGPGILRTNEVVDVVPVAEPVPEPLTMLGAATALGYGAILKRQSSKKTKS